MRFKTVITNESAYPVITLTDSANHCEAEICSFGGLLNAFRIMVKGQVINVIDGPRPVEDLQKNITSGFKSAKLSPFVCRMHKGQYRFEEKEYTIEKFFLGQHAIHGLLFDSIFSVEDTVANDEYARVTLTYGYDGSDAGYPFPYTMKIVWQLEAGNKLTVTTTVSHTNQHPIPLADGWHPYFTLGGSVDEWTLRFDSDTQLEYDADLLPTGKKIKDPRFKNGISLRGIELDNSFELPAGPAKRRCVLQNGLLQLIIEPGENFPILQIYIPPERTSIAIENLSGAPDNFNNGIGLIILPPGEEIHFKTAYTLNIEEGY